MDGSQRRGLFNHWHELGLDNALIRSHQAQPVDARSGYDRAIGGISQAVAQRRNFRSNFARQGEDTERAGLKLLEEVDQVRLHAKLFLAYEYGDFEQAYTAQSDWLSASDCAFEHP